MDRVSLLFFPLVTLAHPAEGCATTGDLGFVSGLVAKLCCSFQLVAIRVFEVDRQSAAAAVGFRAIEGNPQPLQLLLDLVQIRCVDLKRKMKMAGVGLRWIAWYHLEKIKCEAANLDEGMLRTISCFIF